MSYGHLLAMLPPLKSRDTEVLEWFIFASVTDFIQQPRGSAFMSLFQTDKTALLLWIMEHYDVKYNQNRDSNQKISCINRYAHSHGDRNPSAGINISKGLYRCFACGLAGDGYTVLRELEGWGVKQVNEAFGGTPVNEDESDVWI